ncbi:Heat shock 70 kDa protein BIP3, partial [Linum perenne]
VSSLRNECERAKRALNNQTQEPFSRAKFEELNHELLKKIMEVVKSVMSDAKTKKSEIEEIVLVGGSTRIPRVRHMLKEMFDGMEPSKGVNPDEVVAYVAAVFGAQDTYNLECIYVCAGISLFDVTPLSLGIERHGGLMGVVISRNTTIPTKMSTGHHTVADQQTGFFLIKVTS